MKFIEYMKKLDAIKYMAQYKCTGTPRQLAAKLDLTERTVERMIQQLRDDGINIIYNRNRNTYEITLKESFKKNF